MSRYLRRFIVLMVIYLTSIAGFTVTASACETRHFYNHSSKRFSVVFDLNMFNGGATCSIGNPINQRVLRGSAGVERPNCTIPISRLWAVPTSHRPGYPQSDAPETHFDISANCVIEHVGKPREHRRERPATGENVRPMGGRISGWLRLPIGWAWDWPEKAAKYPVFILIGLYDTNPDFVFGFNLNDIQIQFSFNFNCDIFHFYSFIYLFYFIYFISFIYSFNDNYVLIQVHILLEI